MQEFLQFVLRHLIDYPDELVLTKLEDGRKTIFRIRLRQSDIGKVVGKHGQTLAAIRNLISASSRHGEKVLLEILEDEPRPGE